MVIDIGSSGGLETLSALSVRVIVYANGYSNASSSYDRILDSRHQTRK